MQKKKGVFQPEVGNTSKKPLSDKDLKDLLRKGEQCRIEAYQRVAALLRVGEREMKLRLESDFPCQLDRPMK